MLNRLGFGRFFRARAEHRNFAELADDVEQMAHALIDRSRGPLGHRTCLEASERWEWQLGNDLLLLLRYARDHVPSAAAEMHAPARPEPPPAPAAHRVLARLTRSPSWSIFRRKPAPDLIRGGRRFAVDNATKN